MRVLVTGGSGFLGKRVLQELASRGHEPVALVRSKDAYLRVLALGAHPVVADLDDVATVDAAFSSAKADALVNLASLGFGHAPAIIAAAEESCLERAVFVSTTAIFTSLPAASRAVRTAAEEAIHDSSLAWTVIRPTMIYGAPGDRNMERLLAFLRHSAVVPLPGGGKHRLQPVHVSDLAAFVVSALGSCCIAKDFNTAGPDPLTLRELVREAASAIGRRCRLVPVPLGPAVRAVAVYERIASRPRLRVEQVLRLDEDKIFDINAALAVGYCPRTFAAGIAEEAQQLS
jgi:uncharacterized protein YbjT (DUF2867 family)